MHLGNSHLTTVGLLSIFLAGVLLAQLRLVFHNLWVPIGVHFIWNYLQGPVYGFSVSGNATESILIPTFEAPSLINGGEFGIEGSVVTLVVLSGAILMLARLQCINRACYKAFSQGLIRYSIYFVHGQCLNLFITTFTSSSMGSTTH